jgi:hypothetical protein
VDSTLLLDVSFSVAQIKNIFVSYAYKIRTVLPEQASTLVLNCDHKIWIGGYEAPCANPLLMHAEPRRKEIPETYRNWFPIVWVSFSKLRRKRGTHFEDQ